MKVSFNWLKDITSIDVDLTTFVEKMTMSGTKVESVTPLYPNSKNIVVGKIIKIEKHPTADTLKMCTVDVGEATTMILTAATNVEEGQFVPVALHGADLPNGVHIKKTKLRGVESNGMLCSHSELGLDFDDVPGAHPDGILIFQQEYPLGADVLKLLGLDDVSIEFEITSNRPDCFSVMGIAREMAVTFGKTFVMPTVEGKYLESFGGVDIKIENTTLCPRYWGRVVRNVKLGPSPKWMRQRLELSGVRSINNIVDITNYVMLEYGQPLHAFDVRYLKGGKIIVRNAREGERITTLDEVERQLSPEMLVIADEERAVAVAGVMGGANSDIKDDTVEIFFESANFNADSVRRTSKKLDLRTEASVRYGKGVDPANASFGLERACELVNILGAGEVGGGLLADHSHEITPVPPTEIPLECEKINKFLGTNIPREQMENILTTLGFTLSGDIISVPHFRQDVTGFNDIAEEIARIFGYDNIPASFPASKLLGKLTKRQQNKAKIKSCLMAMGLFETCTYSFISPKLFGMSNQTDDAMRLANPLGEETSAMRTNLATSMLEVVAHNVRHRAKKVALFEIGKVYHSDELPLEKLPDEVEKLAICVMGGVDFYDLKGIIESLLDALKITNVKFCAEKASPLWHTNKCCSVVVGGKTVGTFGEVHPAVQGNFDINSEVYYGEFSLDALLDNVGEAKYAPLAKFPSITRDLAIVIDEEIEWARVSELVKRYSGKLLGSFNLFDVYRGKNIPEGKKSLAFSMELRATDRTLKDEDADKTVEKILTVLAKEVGATLRK